MMLMTTPGGKGGTVTLSGESVADIGGGLPKARIRFNADGTVDERADLVSGVYVQVDAATDWIVPNAAANPTYEIKIEEVSASGTATPQFTNPDGVGKGLSTWFTLDSDREWTLAMSAANQVYTWVFDASIRRVGGTVILATGRYTLDVTEISV